MSEPLRVGNASKIMYKLRSKSEQLTIVKTGYAMLTSNCFFSFAEKPELSIILCLPFGPENCKNGFHDHVQKVVETYHLIPFIAKVSPPIILGELNSYLLLLSGMGTNFQVIK
jgi:hypothetical protein